MSIAALCFVSSHAVELAALLVAHSEGRPIYPTEFFPVVVFELAHFVVFFAVGWTLAFAPSRLAAARIRDARHPVRWYLLIGAALGVVAVPIAAAAAHFVYPFQDEDAPTYMARIAEFAVPCLIAGLGGALSYARCVAKHAPTSEDVASIF